MNQSIIKRVLFFMVAIFMSQSIFAQFGLQVQPRKYDVLVKLTGDEFAPKHRIEINELGETSIWATPIPFSHGYFEVRKEEQQYHIQDIDYLSIRDNKRLKKRALIGSAIGLGLGIILAHTDKGINRNDHFLLSPGLKRSFYIMGRAATGAFLGALSGMVRVKIPINGKKSSYAKNRKELEKYVQY